jgi:hypothetical protein
MCSVIDFGSGDVEHYCHAIKLQLINEFSCSISDRAGLVQNVLLVYAEGQCVYMLGFGIL